MRYSRAALALLVTTEVSGIGLAAAIDMVRLYRSKNLITNLCQCEFDAKQNMDALHHSREDAFWFWMDCLRKDLEIAQDQMKACFEK